jgi:hypothetical protein
MRKLLLITAAVLGSASCADVRDYQASFSKPTIVPAQWDHGGSDIPGGGSQTHQAYSASAGMNSDGSGSNNPFQRPSTPPLGWSVVSGSSPFGRGGLGS